MSAAPPVRMLGELVIPLQQFRIRSPHWPLPHRLLNFSLNNKSSLKKKKNPCKSEKQFLPSVHSFLLKLRHWRTLNIRKMNLCGAAAAANDEIFSVLEFSGRTETLAVGRKTVVARFLHNVRPSQSLLRGSIITIIQRPL